MCSTFDHFRAIPRHRIGRVLIDTPAYRAQLRVGDRVLAVNDVSMDDLPHDRIVDLIRQSGQRLQLLERVSPICLSYFDATKI